MILKSIDGRKWIKTALKKCKAYLIRAPINTVFASGSENYQEGVFIVVDKNKMFFPFNYDIDPKSWVHDIKQSLIKYYPRLKQDITETHKLTPDEQAQLLSEGIITSVDDIPTERTDTVMSYCWRVDKVVPFKDTILLYLEGVIRKVDGKKVFLPSGTEGSEPPIMRRYIYTGDTPEFLKMLRSNPTSEELVETSKEFFDSGLAVPLNDVAILDS